MEELNLTQWEKEELENMRGKKIYCNIVSVSRSGMNRKMNFYFINNNELIKCTHLIAKILNKKLDKDHNLPVSGCGMDMIFHVLSSFNYAMARINTGKTIPELLETKECGTRIYDNYYIDANNYGYIS